MKVLCKLGWHKWSDSYQYDKKGYKHFKLIYNGSSLRRTCMRCDKDQQFISYNNTLLALFCDGWRDLD